MKTVLSISFLLACAFVIESKVRPFGIMLNLSVLFVYYCGLRGGQIRGMLLGAAIGAVSDVLAGGMLGPAMLGKATAGYLSAFLRAGFLIWTPVLGFLGIFVVTVVDTLINYSASSIFDAASASFASAAFAALVQSAINSPVGIFIKPESER